ncbi:hypothetical protein KDK_06970 [Dictyobacter kobayashii]|uniref:Rhodanese domain-containing protein n=1 Tax=Dictyobacter kobayashii TaxID=2014872 RepID=A0A402ACR6_9CHLR|nr:hypothetical protein KDK_06970 [Dictyobacter kobayashii]
MAGNTLQQMGYTDVVSMAGGFGQWKGSGLGFTQPRTLNEAQSKRYSRHLLVPEVGEQGQLKLLDSKVLFIGAVAWVLLRLSTWLRPALAPLALLMPMSWMIVTCNARLFTIQSVLASIKPSRLAQPSMR